MAKSMVITGCLAAAVWSWDALNDFEKDNLRKAQRKLHRQTMQKKSGTFISSKDTKKIERAAGVRDQNLAEIDQVTAANKPKRNKLCPCGSGKKYKHCCS